MPTHGEIDVGNHGLAWPKTKQVWRFLLTVSSSYLRDLHNQFGLIVSSHIHARPMNRFVVIGPYCISG
jgi:hypothetical protein